MITNYLNLYKVPKLQTTYSPILRQDNTRVAAPAQLQLTYEQAAALAHQKHVDKVNQENAYGKEGAHYFKNLNGTEISARGTQLKNYFGLKEGQKITPEMWEYAKKNYIKDMGYDNTMSEFFNLVTDEQLPKFLEWINKNAPVVAVPLLVGYTASGYPYKHQKGNKLRQIAAYIKPGDLNIITSRLKRK